MMQVTKEFLNGNLKGTKVTFETAVKFEFNTVYTECTNQKTQFKIVSIVNLYSKDQPPLAYGFVDYNGNVWSDNLVDTYNRYNDEVNKRLNMNFDHYPLGSLCRKELEFYKDQRHAFFRFTVDLLTEKSNQV
jgi:hypothetical protein